MKPVRNAVWDFRWLKRVYLYLRWASPRRVVLFLGSVFLCVVLVGLCGFLLVQDVATSGEMFNGVTIDGTSVGRLSRGEAAYLVEQKVAVPLKRPVTVHLDDHEFSLKPEAIGLRVDVERMVDRAYWQGHGRFVLERMFRRFFNKPIRFDVPVMLSYDLETLKGFVAGIASDLDYAARSASIDMSKGYPVISHSRYGRKVDQEATVKAISESLPVGKRTVQIVARSVRPEVADEDIGPIIVVRQGEHKLYLYDGETLEDTYAVAVGTPQYPTPTGKFYIIEKKKDPWWYPPKSDWARDKKPIPPGPGNPLGPYWMDLGNGLGIHSTPDEASLGYSASHGCIRVSEWAGLQLFNIVEKGTPVYILP